MLKRIIHKLLAHRHPWRWLSFSQLAELYASALLRRAAQSVVGLFIPIYLYQLGYSVTLIMFFLAMTFGFRALTDPLVARLVARKGPKHSMFYSQIMQILALGLLLGLPTYDWPLMLPAIVYGLAGGLYFVPYHVDFSKIMHPEHGGKELGIMQNLQRVGTVLGPAAGGLIAYFFGAEYTLLAGMALFAVAAVPLFFSGEPVDTHQKVYYKGLFRRRFLPDYISRLGFGAQYTYALAVWPLFMAVAIFSSGVYAKVGAVTSIGMLSALFSAYAVGKLVDKRRGELLLKISTGVNSLLHLLRPLTSGFVGVAAVNVANETLTAGYQIPYIKGYYDQADSASAEGQRIAYIVIMQIFSDVGRAVICLAVALLSLVVAPVLALQIGFGLAAGASLLMLAQKFPALK